MFFIEFFFFSCLWGRRPTLATQLTTHNHFRNEKHIWQFLFPFLLSSSFPFSISTIISLSKWVIITLTLLDVNSSHIYGPLQLALTQFEKIRSNTPKNIEIWKVSSKFNKFDLIFISFEIRRSFLLFQVVVFVIFASLISIFYDLFSKHMEFPIVIDDDNLNFESTTFCSSQIEINTKLISFHCPFGDLEERWKLQINILRKK